MNKKFYEKSLDNFKEVTKHPPNFLLANLSLSDTLKVNLKELYDFSQSQEDPAKTLNHTLPKLIVKNLDTEQVWQQIELQNNAVLTRCVPKISRCLSQKTNLIFDKSILSKNYEEKQRGQSYSEDDSAVESDLEDLVPDEDDLSGDEDITDNKDEETTSNNRLSKNKSVVDDDFFKLAEMEEFLKNEEKKLESSNNKETEYSDDDDENKNSDDESVDFFENQKSDEDEAEAKMARFKDYFVQKDNLTKKSKKKSFLSDDGDAEDEHEIQPSKSSLELRQERLSRKIEELEGEAVNDKPWQLKGEVAAGSRPQNSLLQEVLEFDMTSRPAPVITEQTSLQLEDIIRQRIKDKVFDSVERKIKPVETPLDYKKKLVLDQEKSKASLAQIYEKEYLDQQATLDPEHADKDKEPESHKEIKQMMNNLFNKLDALSNFHFTSKPAVPDLKIISNMPAISMEEVAPVAVSDAALLAPQEIKRKTKGDVIGKSEKTKADKNRERRKKKLKQKLHAKEKLKKEEALNAKKNIGGVPVKYGSNKQKLKKG